MQTIRELREERGEAEGQLAAATGVTHATIVDWDRGVARPSAPSLRALTEHFGVRADAINLDPTRPPSLGQRLIDLLDE